LLTLTLHCHSVGNSIEYNELISYYTKVYDR
jgi:hypothetical protein